MFVRRSPAIVLGLVLSAAALAPAPAVASDGGTAKGEPAGKAVYAADDPVVVVRDCSGSSSAKIRATEMSNGEIEVVGIVWSDDEDIWSWKFKHNGDFSFMGEVKAKDAERSFRIVRTMADLAGPDDVFFRAENNKTGEVCKLEKRV